MEGLESLFADLIKDGLTDIYSVQRNSRTDGMMGCRETLTEEEAVFKMHQEKYRKYYFLVSFQADGVRVILQHTLRTDAPIVCPVLFFHDHKAVGRFITGKNVRVTSFKQGVYEKYLEHTGNFFPYLLWSFYKYNINVARVSPKWFSRYTSRRLTFQPVFRRNAIGTTIFQCDVEYNGVSKCTEAVTVEVPWVTPPAFEQKPINQLVKAEFQRRLECYFDESYRRPATVDNMSNNIVGEYWTNDTCEAMILDSVDKRSTYSPDMWLTLMKPKNLVYSFPKNGVARTDGSCRTVFAMDVSYEAYLRHRYGLRNYISEYTSRLTCASKPIKGGRDYRFSYDFRHCDEQLVAYLAGEDRWADLLPYVAAGDGCYRANVFPSGSLFTSALTQLFVEAVLNTAAVQPDSVYICGDAVLSKVEIDFPSLIDVRRERDSTLCGFDYTDGFPRYTRGDRLLKPAYLRRGKISGWLRWAVRYRAYEVFNCVNLPPRHLFERVCLKLKATGRPDFRELTDQQIAQYLSDQPLGVGRITSRAFNVNCRRKQNAFECPSTYYSHIRRATPLPPQVYL